MKELLYDMLISPFEDGEWSGYLVGVLMWAISLLLIGLLLWFSIWLVDSSFMPLKERDGVVTDKYIRPAHYTTTYVMSGKIMIPITTFHRTEYCLEVSIDSLTDEVSVYDDYYARVSIGQKIHCSYTNGRIMKSLYIKNVYSITKH